VCRTALFADPKRLWGGGGKGRCENLCIMPFTVHSAPLPSPGKICGSWVPLVIHVNVTNSGIREMGGDTMYEM
jgi:hypothetical protein